MTLKKKMDIKGFSDERGVLYAVQNSGLPFDIKRVFWIQGVKKGKERGNHAHHKNRQCVICIRGRCTVHLDNGKEKEEVDLKKDGTGIIIEPEIWHTINNFSDDCILLVLASQEHKDKDYIKDYKKFKEFYG